LRYTNAQYRPLRKYTYMAQFRLYESHTKSAQAVLLITT